ncbi:DUF7288 family protein [Halomarina oriensis]|uniref:Uncharacterized protein n=1 Tax=Halomarina oriensis TaxID=671145 RepID=A0A6B0GHT8_9EURY|nr:hypothetical protein [Halomarina oriensis]MWG33361.1 hypothetical protein [Halomarina oriensis]
MVDRGQAHTLEAIMAAVLLLGSLVFALQVTAVTPLSASTSSQHIENQQAATAQGVLAASIDDGSLKRGLLYCDPAPENTQEPKFRETSGQTFYTDAPRTSNGPTGFGEKLEAAFGSQSVAYNVALVYDDDNDGQGFVRRWMVYQGNPSDNAVTASRTVTLLDSDELSQDGGNGTLVGSGTVLGSGEDQTCYGSGSGAGGVHRVVKVEVIVWRQ